MSTLAVDRGYFEFIEGVQVELKGKVVEFVPVAHREHIYSRFNVPVHNTCFVILGRDCTISSEAMLALADAGVVVGFCSHDQTRIHSHTDPVFVLPRDDAKVDAMSRRFDKLADKEDRLFALRDWHTWLLRKIEISWEQHAEDDDRWGPACDGFLRRKKTFERNFKRAMTIDDIAKALKKLEAFCYEQAFKSSDIEFIEKDTLDRPFEMSNPNDLLAHAHMMSKGVASTVAFALNVSVSNSLFESNVPGALVDQMAKALDLSMLYPRAFLYCKDVQNRVPGLSLKAYSESLGEAFAEHEAINCLIQGLQEALPV